MIFDNNLDSTFMMILLGSESTTGKMIMDFVKVIPNNIRTEIIRLTQSGETKKVTIGSYVIDFESEYIGNKLRKRLIISVDTIAMKAGETVFVSFLNFLGKVIIITRTIVP